MLQAHNIMFLLLAHFESKTHIAFKGEKEEMLTSLNITIPLALALSPQYAQFNTQYIAKRVNCCTIDDALPKCPIISQHFIKQYTQYKLHLVSVIIISATVLYSIFMLR